MITLKSFKRFLNDGTKNVLALMMKLKSLKRCLYDGTKQ